MMNKKLYYGSNNIIETPTLGKGNPHNDYGLGFYLTEEFDKAIFWASKNEGGGYVNEYAFNPDDLKILKLGCETKEEVLTWISLLVKNRFSYSLKSQYKNNIKFLNDHFPIDVCDYDVVIGYRADDSYFLYSRDFVGGDLSLESLTKAMKTGKLGMQTVLVSRKAFESISFVNAKLVQASNQYALFRERTSEEYRTIVSGQDDSMTFFRDIVRSYK